MSLIDLPFYDEYKHLNLVFLGEFGSVLYGTNSENSDRDLVGIYMPTKKQIYTGTYPPHLTFKSKPNPGLGEKNTKDDADVTIYSLQYFLHLATKGETAALDLLHSTEKTTLIKSWIWDKLQNDRSKFYCKNMTSLVGYARSQAAKYGIKGSRLKEMKDVLNFISKLAETNSHLDELEVLENIKLRMVWNDLPKGEHLHFLDPNPDDKNKYRMYQVCGQMFPETANLEYMRAAVQKKADEYGERARRAEDNSGVDWKAVSHAIRAAYQVIEIMHKGKIEYPLQNAKYLKDVKYEEHDIKEVQPLLDEMITEAEKLSANSGYPDKVDEIFWENWLYNVVNRSIWIEERNDPNFHKTKVIG